MTDESEKQTRVEGVWRNNLPKAQLPGYARVRFQAWGSAFAIGSALPLPSSNLNSAIYGGIEPSGI